MPDPGLDHRAETARRNGALSRGPVTEAGKARSARNAVRHGLSARSLPEPAAGGALAALRGALLARWQPWDAAEAHLVEELLFAHWRQARLRALEEMVLARLRRGEPLDGLPSLATVLRYRARIDRALARTAAELEALQARRDRIVDPARLRWLADQIERLQAAGADSTNEPTGLPGDANFTNERQSGTNEPAANAGDEKYTNEFPGWHERTLSCAAVAEGGGTQPLQGLGARGRRSERTQGTSPCVSVIPPRILISPNG